MHAFGSVGHVVSWKKKCCSCAYDAKWGNSWHNITYSKSCTVSCSVTWSKHCQDTCEPSPLEQKNTLSTDECTLSHLYLWKWCFLVLVKRHDFSTVWASRYILDKRTARKDERQEGEHTPALVRVFSRRFLVDMASSFSNLSRRLLLTIGFTYILSPRCWFTDKPQSVASANRYGEHSRAQWQRSASTVFLFAIVSPQWYRCRIFYWQSVGLKPESFWNPFWALQLVFFSFFFINSCKALWYSCDGHQQQW